VPVLRVRLTSAFAVNMCSKVSTKASHLSWAVFVVLSVISLGYDIGITVCFVLSMSSPCEVILYFSILLHSLTLNICSFVRQCNTFTSQTLSRHVSASHGHHQL
jgi:hypothetical protein